MLKANAKINWTLKVERRREDGYHDLDMLLSSVTLHDRVKITRVFTQGIKVNVWGHYVSGGENNIAYKAAEAFFEAMGAKYSCRIDIQKHIPVCAGMGGGSADAAAVLIGLNELFKRPFALAQLMKLGAELGADVPFMLAGGLARVHGIGEVIDRLKCPHVYNLVGIMPKRGASTRNIFSRFDINECKVFPDNDEMYRSLVSGDVEKISKCLGNSLEGVTSLICPDIMRIKEALMKCGAAGAQMTGSGTLVFGLFEGEAEAAQAVDKLKNSGLGRVYKFNTAGHGVEMVCRR